MRTELIHDDTDDEVGGRFIGQALKSQHKSKKSKQKILSSNKKKPPKDFLMGYKDDVEYTRPHEG